MAVLHHTGQPRAVTRCAPDDPTWLTCLPGEWRDMVIEPLDFKEHREYEMAAGRTFGYDVDGLGAGNAAAYAEAGAQILVTSAPYFARPRDVAVTMESG